MAEADGIFPYIPDELGEISELIQTVESIGEAYHDFIGERSNIAVRLAIHNYFHTTKGQSEETTSEIIHRAFNNGIPVTKADLRLSTISKIYTDPQRLAEHLFFGVDNVKPLVFMINRGDLGAPAFDSILNELQRRMHIKYGLRVSANPGVGAEGNPAPPVLYVTRDAYKFVDNDDRRGNPFLNTREEMAGSTLFDPGMSGSGQADISIAQNEGRFHLTPELVNGSSHWGTYRIITLVQNGRYNGLQMNLTLSGLKVNPVKDNQQIQIIYPKALIRGPSVEVLANIYSMITKYNINNRILSEQGMIDILGAIRIKNTGAGSFDTGFYTSIIRKCSELYLIHKDFALIFIFFLKELGDMLQHKVGIKFKHLAIGSWDGLSTIAFLKRGGPISYIPKKGNLLFRVAGTLHKTGGMTPAEIAQQVADVQAEVQARIAAAAANKIAARQRIIDERASMEAARIATEAAAKARKQQINDRRTATRAKINASKQESGKKRAAPVLPEGRSVSQKTLRRTNRKQVGGSKWGKTFKKQKGGGNIMDALIIRLINALFNNLDYVIDNPEASTSLFNITSITANNTVIDDDFAIIANFDDNRTVFLNNKLLGLPLCSILYMLYEELFDLDSSLINAKKIIIQFLSTFNFNQGDIERIIPDVFPNAVLADVPAAEIIDVDGEGTPIIQPYKRELNEFDKEELRKFVDKGYDIPGIIPYEYAIRRDNITGSSYETPVTEEEIMASNAQYNIELQQEEISGPELILEEEAPEEEEAAVPEEEEAVAPAPEEAVEEAAVQTQNVEISTNYDTNVDEQSTKPVFSIGKKIQPNTSKPRSVPKTVPLLPQYPFTVPARKTRKQRKSRRNTTWKK